MGEGSIFSVTRELARLKFGLYCRFDSRSGQIKDQVTVYVASPYHKMQNQKMKEERQVGSESVYCVQIERHVDLWIIIAVS